MKRIQEVYVILEDKPGALGELCEVLAKNKINIESIAAFGDSAKLIVQNIEKTKKVLEKNNYVVEIRDVLSVEMENKPGELAFLTSRIGHVGINIAYLYSAFKAGESTATVIMDVSNIDTVMSLLK